MQELLFLQLFPYSEKAREYLKKEGLSLEDLPEQAVKRAALMVSRASAGKIYLLDLTKPSEDVLRNEIIAFPVAKMFVSAINNEQLIEKFSLMIQRSTFQNLMNSKNRTELCLDLAREFGVKYSLSEEKSFFVEISLTDFLAIEFNDEELRLINQAIEKGKVFLDLNDFARFLSELAFIKVKSSLPIDKSHIPKQILQLAKSLENQIYTIEKKKFDLSLIGKIEPEFFPPCMKIIYTQQLEGKKLPYLSRLSLASFLRQLEMNESEMLKLFSKSPDYQEHLAKYHIKRIFDKQLSAPGCAKLRDYGLRVKECEKECKYKHPVQYYIAKFRSNNKIKNSKHKEVNK